MPVKVIKYRCGFKCGKKAMNNIVAAEKHEKICFKNPENKTCATCKNEIYERDSDGFAYWCTRDCMIKEMSDFIESIHEDLEIKKSSAKHIKPLFNCPNHNKDIAQEGTIEYIELIGKRILYAKSENEKTDSLPF